MKSTPLFQFLLLLPLVIIGRHDLDRKVYLEIGNDYATSIVNLNLLEDTPDGMATFVSSRWLLTAAHCAEIIDQKLRDGATHQVEFAGNFYEVDSVLIHPTYFEDAAADLALVRLATEPETPHKIYKVYNGHDELGQVIRIAGYGDVGDGKTGPQPNSGKVLLGGTNRITEATDWWLKFIFDAPGTEGVTQYEAISGPGDSGGPAFLTAGNDTFLAGVGSGQSTSATNGVEGVYGVKEYYVRLSRYHDWIQSVIQ